MEHEQPLQTGSATHGDTASGVSHLFQSSHPHGRMWRGTKQPLDESERGELKSWLKAQLSEN